MGGSLGCVRVCVFWREAKKDEQTVWGSEWHGRVVREKQDSRVYRRHYALIRKQPVGVSSACVCVLEEQWHIFDPRVSACHSEWDNAAAALRVRWAHRRLHSLILLVGSTSLLAVLAQSLILSHQIFALLRFSLKKLKRDKLSVLDSAFCSISESPLLKHGEWTDMGLFHQSAFFSRSFVQNLR